MTYGARPGRWAPTAAILDGGAPASLAPVRDGRAGVQDEGSQLVALALAAVPIEGPDARWLDMCAGPGGKAALLAGLAAARGARVLAVERQPHRARLVAHAVGDTADVVVADSVAGPWARGSFDRVLVDVPCSGLGALRRRPEARWRRQPSRCRGAAASSRRRCSTLRSTRCGRAASSATSPVRRTCTRPAPWSTRWLAGVRMLRLSMRGRSSLALIRSGPGPDVQLWPHLHGTDAMYLCLLRRRSEPAA